MAVGLVAVSSALYLSRVPARSFTPEVRLWCAAYIAFLLTLSLARATVPTRVRLRDCVFNFFFSFFIERLCSRPSWKKGLFRAAEKSWPVLQGANFNLDSSEGSGGSEKRGGARDGTSIMAARFEGSVARAGNGVFARARETICPSTDIRAASLTTRKEVARTNPELLVVVLMSLEWMKLYSLKRKDLKRIERIAACSKLEKDCHVHFYLQKDNLIYKCDFPPGIFARTMNQKIANQDKMRWKIINSLIIYDRRILAYLLCWSCYHSKFAYQR